LRRNWLLLLLPPAFFLLAAGVTRQLLWTWRGSEFSACEVEYREAMEAARAGDLGRALDRLVAAGDHAPDDAGLHRDLAGAFERLGQSERALLHLERSVRLRPPDVRAWTGLARAHCDCGRFDAAARLLEELKERLPAAKESAEVLYCEALVSLWREGSAGGPEAALELLARSLKADADSTDARILYGTCLARLGRLDDAEKALRELAAAHPRYGGAHHELGEVLRRKGDLDGAKESLKKFQEIDESWQRLRHLETRCAVERADPREIFELGGLYLEVGQPAQALGALLRFTRLEPASAEGRRRLAEAYERLERKEDAEAERKLAEALAGRDGGAPK
jgi:tetratricopeptide (TPR) repeat protein